VKNRFGTSLLKENEFVKYGSYCKGTNVGEIDDFDILVVFNSYNMRVENERYGCWGSYEGFGVGEELKLSTDIRGYDNKYSSEKFLDFFYENIKDAIPTNYKVPEKDPPAVTLTFREGRKHKLHIDLIPALKFTYGNSIFYMIPDGNGAWTRTNPKDLDQQIQDVQKMTKDIGPKENTFKNVIRIVKYIKSQHNIRNLKSFEIEVLALEWAKGYSWKNLLSKNFCSFLFYITEYLKGKKGTLKDPSTDTELLIGVDKNHLFDTLIKILNEICNENIEAAIEIIKNE
jgi:hypothetical protein